jgi:Fur family transcriptional regulator, ferric uptake regulator
MSDQRFEDLLKTRDLKATGHRMNLLTQMKAYKSAMPYSFMQESLKTIDRVTLYRTLETLTEQGVIHKAFQDNNDVYYAICGKKCSKNQHLHDHIHFKCINCHAVTCEQTSQLMHVSIPGFEIQKVSVSVKGICKTCNAELDATNV